MQIVSKQKSMVKAIFGSCQVERGFLRCYCRFALNKIRNLSYEYRDTLLKISFYHQCAIEEVIDDYNSAF